MKTHLTWCVALLLSASVFAIPPNDEPDLNVNNQYQTRTATFGVGMFPKKGVPVINLLVDNYSDKSIGITLRDSKGVIYHTERMDRQQRRAWMKFNMSQLKDDVYQVVIQNGKDRVIKEVNVKTQQVPLTEPHTEEQKLISMR